MAPRDRNDPTRSASSDGTYTRADLEREFPDDATCLSYLWRQNWSPDGQHAHCPKCDVQRRFHRVQSRPSYSCDSCGHHLHPTAGTIFHKSSTGLDLWFKAIFLMGSTRCGMSAKQLERELGVTYKTAWRMANLIRTRLMDQGDDMTLSGSVEIDETYIGGKRRGFSGRPGYDDENKVPVFGMVERQGRVVAVPVRNAKAATLLPIVRKRVLPESVIYSDTWSAYHHLHRDGYDHRRIRHSEGVYVMGDVHTQTIEGFWSLVKRGLAGTYHAVSAKHLQGYLNEFTWRYNHRHGAEPMFRLLLRNACRSAC